jgi:phosphoglycolate phosphatase
MKNDALIFDLDGTLWNACAASAKGWNVGFAKLGINKKVTTEQIESIAGNPFDKCIEILFPGLEKQYPQLFDVLEENEIEVVKCDGATFYEGVIDGLKDLSKKYKIFIVSNCQEWYLKLFFKFSGLEKILTGYDCYGMSGISKGEMLKRIQSKFSLKNPVYIGDTASDESAAEIAEMEYIYVSYGFGSPKNKAKTFDTFNELKESFIV